MNLTLIYDDVHPFVSGGAGYRLFMLATGLSRLGHNVNWLCEKCWNESEDTLEHEGITLIAVSRRRELIKKEGVKRRTLRNSVPYIWGLLRYGIPRETDIVIAGQTPLLHILAVLLQIRFGRKKLVVDYWEYWGRYWFRYYRNLYAILGFCVERAVVMSADAVTAISEMGLKKLASVRGCKNTFIVRNGVDIESISLARRRSQARFDFVYFGRCESHKNIDAFIRAIPFSKRSSELRVAIIGNGSSFRYLVELTEDLGLSNQVCFFGELSHAEAYKVINTSLNGFMLSDSEGGSSIAVEELLAFGVPVLTFYSPQGLDDEIYRDDLIGSTLSSLEPHDVAQEIDRSLDKQVYLSRVERISLRHCHTWKDSVEELESVLSLLKN